MAERLFLGKIHKVTLGPNPGDRSSIGYTVGYPVSREHSYIKVTSIEIDESMYERFGKLVCVIWVTNELSKGEKVASVFKTLIDIPLTLSRDLSELN